MYDETKLSNVGFRIRFFRMEKSISQSELAQQIGISQTHLSNIECGRVQIGLKLLLRLANLLQHRLDELRQRFVENAARQQPLHHRAAIQQRISLPRWSCWHS